MPFSAALEEARSAAAVSGARMAAGGPSVAQAPFRVDDWLSDAGRTSGLGSRSTGSAREQYQHNRGRVAACVSLISERISAQPAHVAVMVGAGQQRRPPTQKSVRVGGALMLRGSVPWFRAVLPPHLKALAPDLELIETHPLLDALDNPNELMTRSTMLDVTTQSLQLTGDSFWWVFIGDDGRLQIWPLPSDWFRPDHSEGLFKWWLVGPNLASAIRVPGEQIVHFFMPDPSNPFRSLGTLQKQALAVLADEAIAEAQRRGFSNGMLFDAAIVVNKLEAAGALNQGGSGRAVLSATQRSEILAGFVRRHRGVGRSYEPVIIDGFIEDVKKIGNNPREMDFQRSGEYADGRVTQGFRVNPISMGRVENASRNSSASADDHLLGNLINPALARYSEVLSAWMGPIFSSPGETLVFFFESAKSHDDELELTRTVELHGAGLTTVNESRQSQGLPPVRGGDVAIIGGMAVPFVGVDEPRPDPDDPDSDIFGGVKPTEPAPALPAPAAEPDGGGEPGPPPASYHSARKAMTTEAWRGVWLKAHGRIETEFARAMQRHLAKEGRLIANALRQKYGRRTPASAEEAAKVYDVEAAGKRTVTVAREPMHAAMAQGAVLEWEAHRPRRRSSAAAAAREMQRALPDVEDLLIRLPSRVRDRINGTLDDIMGQPYWLDMPATTREEIIRSLQSGIDRGISGSEMADEIEDAMGGIGGAVRARNIARTESTGALNFGTEESRAVLAEEGLLRGKRWMVVDDDDLRDDHREADGQEVGVDEQFTVGGERCDCPGDFSLSAAQRCGCRCGTESLVIDPTEERAAVERFWRRYYQARRTA